MSQDLFKNAQELLEKVQAFATESKDELERFRIDILGSKGKVRQLFGGMKAIEADKRKEFGQLANAVKQAAETKLSEIRELIEDKADETIKVPDMFIPVNQQGMGSRHPLAVVMNQMIDIFTRIGFVIEEGPEIETDWYNFTALNTPENHPARDMQDTFYINRMTDPAMLLRTHTSAAQSRVMKDRKPPIRIIVPGRVYRNETISARAHCQFHQVEGLYIDEGVSFADLKQTLLYFAREMFGEHTNIQLRPSFFPFTEPSAEMDVSCFVCDAKGCAICKHTGWVEILGCGMVDPKVLENCGIDSEKYTGFAFGIGIERTTMLRYKVDDIRLMFENDARFLRQFSSTL